MRSSVVDFMSLVPGARALSPQARGKRQMQTAEHDRKQMKGENIRLSLQPQTAACD